jgi:tetratricopeptide (TPR) repeat protein
MIQKCHAEALPWLKESLTIFEREGARLSMATVWSEMAVCHLGLGDDRKSLALLENALQEYQSQRVPQNYLVALANIGNVYLHRDDHLTAIAYYRRALEMAREINDPVSIQKWSFNLRLAYARLRDSIDRMGARTRTA